MNPTETDLQDYLDVLLGLGDILNGRTKPFHQIQEELRKVENHSYDFVAKEEDVDYIRIVREAPKDTPFIFVEERTRNGYKPSSWTLLVHNDLLKRLEGLFLVLDELEVNASWGDDEIPTLQGPKKLYSYRTIGGSGRFPGHVKQQVEKIKRMLNPKQTVVRVSYP